MRIRPRLLGAGLAVLALALPLSAAAQARAPVPARPGAPKPAQPAQPPPLLTPTVYTVEEIAIGQFTPELRQVLTPVHSLQQAEDLLKVRGVAFAWRRAELNSGMMELGLARQMAALPPHEVFIVPSGEGAVLGVIVQQRAAPPPGPS